MTNKPKPLGIQPRKLNQPQTRGSRKFPKDPAQLPCPVCGGRDFEWGYLAGQAGYNQTQSLAGAQPLSTRLCLSCGNALLFLRSPSS